MARFACQQPSSECHHQVQYSPPTCEPDAWLLWSSRLHPLLQFRQASCAWSVVLVLSSGYLSKASSAKTRQREGWGITPRYPVEMSNSREGHWPLGLLVSHFLETKAGPRSKSRMVECGPYLTPGTKTRYDIHSSFPCPAGFKALSLSKVVAKSSHSGHFAGDDRPATRVVCGGHARDHPCKNLG